MKRTNIGFTQESYDQMRRMMEAGGVATMRELFDNCLTILNWVMKQRQAGRIIGSLGEDGQFTELSMPILDKAACSKVKI